MYFSAKSPRFLPPFAEALHGSVCDAQTERQRRGPLRGNRLWLPRGNNDPNSIDLSVGEVA
jgi:hypothetical protein